MAVAVPSVDQLADIDRARRRIIVAAGIALSLLGGAFAGALGGSGHVLTVAIVVVVALPFVFWRVPTSAIITLLCCATLIEQFPYNVGSSTLDAFTDRIPVFASLSGGFGLSGFTANPFEVALIVVILVWLFRGIADHSLRLPRSRLASAVGLLLVLVLVAVVHGLATGGDSRATLWEVRPWLYLSLSYLLASQLMTTRIAIRAVLWTLVIGTGFKAAQGVLILYQARNLLPKPEDILAHEEAFFFGMFMMITLGLWIFKVRGRLRTTATVLIPLVIVADLGNYRRTAWLILGADLIVMLALAYVALPDRRRLIRRVALAVAATSLVYFPVFWNSTGTLAQPARAIRSAISPDTRDMQSNAYRQAENANLGSMIKRSPLLGSGFGIPIDYTSAAIVDISNVDSFIAYVPHNGVLAVWMRMGAVGEMGLWFMVASAMLLGSRASRSADREVGLLGALAVCAVVAWVIEGYNDMGFFWFRMAITVGCLLGLLQSAVRRDPSLQAQGVARIKAA